MLHHKKYDHRIKLAAFYELLNDQTDSIELKMIDFSNIIELKERIVNF